MLIRLIVVVISQCISKHHLVYLKYIVFVDHTSVKLGEVSSGKYKGGKDLAGLKNTNMEDTACGFWGV